MKTKAFLLALSALGFFTPSFAQTCDEMPERAVIVTGDSIHPQHYSNIAEMNSRIGLAFEDPAAPRFLFLDKKGAVALGIGGYFKAIGEYDFDGAVNNNDFYTNLIPVPFSAAQRQRFGASAAHSTIFLKMVTRPTKLGRIIVYIQTNFTGDNGGYGLKLKQAYLTVGHVTIGKARSVFADGPAMAPTVDDQGPSGQVTAKNMAVQYVSPSYKGFSFAVSAETAPRSYTEGPQTEAIDQRCPDIPAYVQYAWDGGSSHVRLSGIFRELSYRDELTAENKFATGWGAQFSAVGDIYGGLGFFGHYTYGKGIASYVNDLADLDYDLVPGSEGKLKAAGAAGWTAGLKYQFNENFFVTGSYSRAQLYDTDGMASDTFRYSQYIAANAFYNPIEDLRIGLEYIHGTRRDISGQHGHANRLELAMQYSF